MSVIERLRDLLRGDRQADRLIPPTGFTARLLTLGAAIMAFLAVFALALSLASGRLASSWGQELAQSSTIRIVAATEDQPALTQTTLKILETTPGVAFARALDAQEQQALLAPWFGPDVDLSGLPVPQLIEVVLDTTGFEAEGLRLRLAAEVPQAVFDDHATWRAPLVTSANRLRALGIFSVLLLALAMSAMIILAADAALFANTQVIRVLRLVGATDGYIADAFVRRFTQRALLGAAVGTVCGVVAVASLPETTQTGGLLTEIGFQGGDWLVVVLIPVLAGAAAFAATGWSARRIMKGLP